MTLPVFTLRSATTQAAAPFTLGHAFKKGDVPAGAQLVSDVVNFQVVAKNVWPDGSLKFAILSGVTAITGGVPLTVALSIGTPTVGAARTLVQLKATGVTAAIDGGAFGAASWAGTDWDSPFVAWVAGPVMSSWIYRKEVGADAHLVGWLEVRLYAGGAVEVLPWIENGYFFKAGPTNKSATYSSSLGGAQRFNGAIDLKHHQRTPLVSGALLAHWLGADPGVTPTIDVAYFQATELVPTYSATSTTNQLAALMPATFYPLQQGGFDYPSDVMSGTGYSSAIGLIPTHDVAYLVCTDNPVLRYASVVRNGYSAGRYGIHFRDETTNYPPRFSTYPTAGLWDAGSIKNAGAVNGAATPAATGGSSPQWDMAHSPSIGYMAYMLTGRYYFMEEVQFAAVTNHFSYTDWVRAGGTDMNGYHYTGANGASGIYVGYPETRSAAWGIRSLFLATSATPDGHPLQSEFTHSVEENARYFNAVYAGVTANIFGNIAGGEGSYQDWPGIYAVPMFQQNFVTAAWGMGLAMDLPISTTAKDNMASFFAWKAKGVVGCLGPSTGFWYINGAQFIMPASPTRTVDILGGTGPWYATFKQAYDVLVANFVPSYGFALSTTEGQLYYEDTVLRVRGMWGVTMPAIAYAVRHAVPGAAAAYDRVIGASNFNLFANDLAAAPVWGVAPSGQTTTGGTTVTTPGPSTRVGQLFDDATAVSVWRGIGVLAADIPAGSLLANDVDPNDPPGTEYMMEMLTGLSVGTLDIGEYSDAAYTPPSDSYVGVATGTQRVFTNEAYSDTTISFTSVASDSQVTGVTLSPASATVAAGGTQQFTWAVQGTNSPLQTVSLSASAGSISSGGLLTADSTASQHQITVTATSTQDPSFSDTATVTVQASTITGVTISPSTISSAGGVTRTLSASVQGTGSQSITWSKVSGGGTLTGASFTEPAQTSSLQTIVLKAASTQDATKFALLTITIAAASGSGSTPGDTTPPVMVGVLTASGLTQTGYTLHWQAVSDAAGYQVSTNGGTSYASVASNVLSYAVTGKSASTAYANRVRAIDAAANLATPLSLTITTLADSVDGPLLVANNNMLELDLDYEVLNVGADTFKRRGRQYYIDKDPEAIQAYGVNMASHLANAGNDIGLVSVETLVEGVTLDIAGTIQGTYLVARLSGGTPVFDLDKPNYCTFRFTLSNGDVDDITIRFNIVNK